MNKIKELKKFVDIEDFIGNHIQLMSAGKYRKAICPFHADSKPSLIIKKPSQTFKCFGCGESGDVIDFCVKIDGIAWSEAVKKLKEIAVQNGYVEVESTTTKVLNLAQSFFRQSLLKCGNGSTQSSFLAERSISVESQNEWLMGYSPKDPMSLYNYLKAKGVNDDEMVESSLFSAKLTPLFSHRITMPIFDEYGEIVAFGARKISSTDKSAKYLNTVYKKHDTLFGMSRACKKIQETSHCFVTEGYMDAIQLHAAGIKNVVAVLSASVSDMQIKKIKKIAKHITLMLDGNSAGIAAMKKAACLMLEHGVMVSVVVLPSNEDPDNTVRRLGFDYNAIMREIKSCAMNACDFFLSVGMSANGIADVIRKIPEPETQFMMLKHLSYNCNIPISVLAASQLAKQREDKCPSNSQNKATTIDYIWMMAIKRCLISESFLAKIKSDDVLAGGFVSNREMSEILSSLLNNSGDDSIHWSDEQLAIIEELIDTDFSSDAWDDESVLNILRRSIANTSIKSAITATDIDRALALKCRIDA